MATKPKQRKFRHAQQRSDPRSGIHPLQPAHPPDDPRVVVRRDPPGARTPEAAVDAEGEHYRYSTGQVHSQDQTVTATWFSADEVEGDISLRRRAMWQRLWRLDEGLDVDPGDRTLGIDAVYYIDETVNVERVTDWDRFRHHMADACFQTLEIPRVVRERALDLFTSGSLLEFGHYGGLEGAIVGVACRALAEFLGLSEVEQLKDTAWWPRIDALADELGVKGATGRQFQQLLDHVEASYRGGDPGGAD